MDYFLNPKTARNRLFEEYKKYGSFTVAVDFDDTVYDFDKKDRTYENVIELLKELRSLNCF